MFSKTKPSSSHNAAPQPEPAPVAVPPLPDLNAPKRAPIAQATPGKAVSVLASDLHFEGNITGTGDLHIDGTVRGDIKVQRLTVGETGNVEGSIQSDYVEIRGRVVGAVSGKQVKLVGTAFVDGDISHEQLSIDVGAYFQGRCLQSRKDGAHMAAPAQPSHSSYTPPSYGAPAAAAPVDTGQLIELKPASA